MTAIIYRSFSFPKRSQELLLSSFHLRTCAPAPAILANGSRLGALLARSSCDLSSPRVPAQPNGSASGSLPRGRCAAHVALGDRKYSRLLSAISSTPCNSQLFATPVSAADTWTNTMGIGTENLTLCDPSLIITKGLIGADWVGSDNGDTFPVLNPATGELIVELPKMGESETQRAIAVADKAFAVWKKKTAKERSGILWKWFNLLTENAQDLAKLMTLENGKPLHESMIEVTYGNSFVEWFSEEAKRVYGDIIPATVADRKLLVVKQPVGVVGAITPWNFPLAMITRKVAPALAVGCTVVLKPSELTPLTALATAELALRAGLPPGVLNIVFGDAPAVGKAILESDQVRKITFTGSTAVGKLLMRGSADTVKKISLELGGNAPCIIFDDADVEVAVRGTMATKYRNAGQTCVSANRIFVQDGIYDEFSKKLSEAVAKLKVGNGFDKGVSIGPLINENGLSKVERLVNDAVAKGATVLTGGKRHALGGTFFDPTVLGDASNDMILFREEIFGPIAPLFRFHTEEEVVTMANDTQYGLAAYMFTRDMSRGWRVAEALEYGMVGWNEAGISTEVAPFGGIKQSGLGREGSKYGVDDFVEMKYVCMGGLQL